MLAGRDHLALERVATPLHAKQAIARAEDVATIKDAVSNWGYALKYKYQLDCSIAFCMMSAWQENFEYSIRMRCTM